MLVLIYGGVVLALVAMGAPAAVRAVPVLAYVALAPGLACVRLIRLHDRLAELLLGVGLSLALGTVVAVAMLYIRLFSPTLGIAGLVAIASTAAVIEVFHGRLVPSIRRSPGGRSS